MATTRQGKDKKETETVTQEDLRKSAERLSDIEGKFMNILKEHMELVKTVEGVKKELEVMKKNHSVLQEKVCKMEKEMDTKKADQMSFAEIVKQQAEEVKKTRVRYRARFRTWQKCLRSRGLKTGRFRVLGKREGDKSRNMEAMQV